MRSSEFVIPEQTLVQFVVEGNELVIKDCVQCRDIAYASLYIASVHSGLRKHASDMRVQDARVVLIFDKLELVRGAFVPAEYSFCTYVTMLSKNWLGRDKKHCYVDAQLTVRLNQENPELFFLERVILHKRFQKRSMGIWIYETKFFL